MKFSFNSYLSDMRAMLSRLHLSLNEWIVLVIMVSFVIMPLPVPQLVADSVATVPGVACVLAANISLLIYASPYIGVTAIVAASELIRRSYRANNTRPGYAPAAARKQTNILTRSSIETSTTASAFAERSLEESIVDQLAPVGRAPPAEFVETDFKPMYDNVHNALMT